MHLEDKMSNLTSLLVPSIVAIVWKMQRSKMPKRLQKWWKIQILIHALQVCFKRLMEVHMELISWILFFTHLLDLLTMLDDSLLQFS